MSAKRSGTLATEDDVVLSQAITPWVERGESREIVRWLDRELDRQLVPVRLPIDAWWPTLDRLEEARRRRPEGWPVVVDVSLEGFLRAALWFTGHDGNTLLTSGKTVPLNRRRLLSMAERTSDSMLERIVTRLFPGRSPARAWDVPPPPPSLALESRVLAVLRSDWGRRPDLIAIDQRERADSCRFELIVSGRRLLGPRWETLPGPSRPFYWSSAPHAELYEWSSGDGSERVLHTALLLRHRKLALLAAEFSGSGPTPRMAFGVAVGVEATPHSTHNAIRLGAGGKLTCQFLPLSLPATRSETKFGSFAVEDGQVLLEATGTGRRSWLPVLLSWDASRNRRPTNWRPLTVAERSRPCPPGVAFAARVGWGRGDGLVVYRSLERPALRSFLGHQTRARFLLGVFTRDGNVTPLVTVLD